MSGILFLDNNDEVLDVINDFPDETKESCLKFLSEEPEKGSSFIFLLPDRGFGVVMKFVLPGDDGLIFMGADDSDEIISALEQLRDATAYPAKKEIEERLNAIRYSFARIKATFAEEQTKRLGQ